ncbi:unnamed protein product [Candidula unifasciata]|uniref:PX domain-containing protein n=1 Tax=Candidula unifasciata TaxID=100452 RepID=A0A8S3Z0F4_9EUPU|nr:unnamed protein product [Candidula unifasciata]
MKIAIIMQDETISKCLKMKEELLPRILVKDPVTHDSWEQGRFTTYLICIKTEHPAFHLRLSAVRRRFSELRWLYNVLRENHSHVHFPKPPGKKVFAERFEAEFIDTRMMEIQNYLNELLITDTVLSDAAFHFFVQTDLTTEEIQEYLNGTLSENIVAEAWENAGHLHTSSYIVNSIVIPHEPQEIAMNEEDLQHMSRSLDTSNSYSPTQTSGDLSYPTLTTIKESQDLNTHAETSLKHAHGSSPAHVISGFEELIVSDVPPVDIPATCDGDKKSELSKISEAPPADTPAFPSTDESTTCGGDEKSELSKISEVPPADTPAFPSTDESTTCDGDEKSELSKISEVPPADTPAFPSTDESTTCDGDEKSELRKISEVPPAERPAFPSTDESTTCDGDEKSELRKISEVPPAERPAFPSTDESTTCDGNEKSELSKISDSDDDVITEIGNKEVKMNLPEKNVPHVPL